MTTDISKTEQEGLNTVGLVAGRGDLPLQFCRCAREAGVEKLIIAAVKGEAKPEIADYADSIGWVSVGQLKRMIDFCKAEEVKNIVFAGQIKPSKLFSDIKPDVRAMKLLWRLREKNAHSIFSAVAEEFEASGIHVLPSTMFMEDELAEEGCLGKVKLKNADWDDINFGIGIAREISALDIGQTVVVKNGTVLAVEAFEGTDEAIKRGGRLGNGGVTVVKLAKRHHDMRFDVPCIGMNTLKSLQEARTKTLAIQAGKTIFLDKSDFLSRCNKEGIAVAGFQNDED